MKLIISLAKQPKAMTVQDTRAKILEYCWPNPPPSDRYCHFGCYQYMRQQGFPDALRILLIADKTGKLAVHSIVVDGLKIAYDMAMDLNKIDSGHKVFSPVFDGHYYAPNPASEKQAVIGQVTAEELREEVAKATAFKERAFKALRQMSDILTGYARGTHRPVKSNVYNCFLYVKNHDYGKGLNIRLLVDQKGEGGHIVVTKFGTIVYDAMQAGSKTALSMGNLYVVDGRPTSFKIVGGVAAETLKAVDPDYSGR